MSATCRDCGRELAAGYLCDQCDSLEVETLRDLDDSMSADESEVVVVE